MKIYQINARVFILFLTKISNTSQIQFSRRQQLIFDDFWRQLDSGNYSKGLNAIPEDVVEPLELYEEEFEYQFQQTNLCPKNQFLLNEKCYNRLNCAEIHQQISPHQKI